MVPRDEAAEALGVGQTNLRDAMPLLADIGIDPGEPELIEIHNIVKR